MATAATEVQNLPCALYLPRAPTENAGDRPYFHLWMRENRLVVEIVFSGCAGHSLFSNAITPRMREAAQGCERDDAGAICFPPPRGADLPMWEFAVVDDKEYEGVYTTGADALLCLDASSTPRSSFRYLLADGARVWLGDTLPSHGADVARAATWQRPPHSNALAAYDVASDLASPTNTHYIARPAPTSVRFVLFFIAIVITINWFRRHFLLPARFHRNAAMRRQKYSARPDISTATTFNADDDDDDDDDGDDTTSENRGTRAGSASDARRATRYTAVDNTDVAASASAACMCGCVLLSWGTPLLCGTPQPTGEGGATPLALLSGEVCAVFAAPPRQAPSALWAALLLIASVWPVMRHTSAARVSQIIVLGACLAQFFELFGPAFAVLWYFFSVLMYFDILLQRARCSHVPRTRGARLAVLCEAAYCAAVGASMLRAVRDAAMDAGGGGGGDGRGVELLLCVLVASHALF